MRLNRGMHRTAEVVAAVQGAVVAEVGWRESDGTIRLVARMPFVLDATPALALTYDELDLAGRLAGADQAILAVSDARHALRGWRPLTVPVTASVVYDPEGETFTSEVVDQELRKCPPARLRADSLLQRRENWWYLARALVTLRPLAAPSPVAPRHQADQGVLCADAGSQLVATTVDVADWGGELLRLRARDEGMPAGVRATRPPGGPAALLRHDFTADLERRATLVITGRLEDDVLWPAARNGQAALPAVPGVWRRFRDARAFERACRRAIRAVGH